MDRWSMKSFHNVTQTEFRRVPLKPLRTEVCNVFSSTFWFWLFWSYLVRMPWTDPTNLPTPPPNTRAILFMSLRPSMYPDTVTTTRSWVKLISNIVTRSRCWKQRPAWRFDGEKTRPSESLILLVARLSYLHLHSGILSAFHSHPKWCFWIPESQNRECFR